MADVTGRYSLEDTMHDLEPVKARSQPADGDDYTFAHAPARQPIGIPAQTLRDCSAWPDVVNRRLDALEGESLPVRVARLEAALVVVVNALYAVDKNAATAASRALSGIIRGPGGLVVAP